MKKSRCLVNLNNPRDPKITLVCFHYAGGSAGVFHNWANLLPGWIKLVALEMPGRGARFREEPLQAMEQVTAEIMSHIPEYLSDRLVFFGHSLGALVAFETARHMLATTGYQPELLIVSGKRPPHLGENENTDGYRRKKARNFVPVHQLDEEAFLQELRQLNGTPGNVLENKSLMEICLPYLRADFQINETYMLDRSIRLDCPLISMGGEKDLDVPLEDLKRWEEMTEGYSEHYTFPGDHFFTHSHEKQVVGVVTEAIVNLVNLKTTVAV